ncbi:site-specific integrase [Ramlibacter tataouinensis]|uniref:tyrosine-type recombinase/integrase n=1 Tax=Ramlibacter tataouinensis TaxID=94132 RepID=UPI0022F3C9BA|nr:site-specific integrase [Ramlibacter tataouinensis]WBY00513.1 site-specific integrase [Ramlibacter tataouinensis]
MSPPVSALCPLPLRAGSLPTGELIELYMTHYSGRDTTRGHRLSWWKARVGHLALQDLSDDHIHVALQGLSQYNSRYFAGRDADHKPIFKARPKPVAPATLNRYAAALAAVLTWAIKKRIAPKHYVHPCRTIERQAENNERVRFLSDDERERLLKACQASGWDKLYLIVLMALTTGARKSDLTSLRWDNIDFERQQAYCGRSKNGDPRVLPLVAPVLALLRQHRGGDAALIFGSTRVPGIAFDFKDHWRRALAAARIRNFRFHDLRHSCASTLAQHGATLLEIADVLGHRQLQMTKRYSHLTTGHKAELIERVWGDLPAATPDS